MKNWQILELWSPPSFWAEIWDVGDQLTSKDLFYFFYKASFITAWIKICLYTLLGSGSEWPKDKA